MSELGNSEHTPIDPGIKQAEAYRDLQKSPEKLEQEIRSLRTLLDKLNKALDTLSSYSTQDATTIRSKKEFLDRMIKGVTFDVGSIPEVRDAMNELFPELPPIDDPNYEPDSANGKPLTAGQRQFADHMYEIIKYEDSLEQARQNLEWYLQTKIQMLEVYIAKLEA